MNPPTALLTTANFSAEPFRSRVLKCKRRACRGTRSAGPVRSGASFEKAAAWRGKWVVLQYTALGWSRRGFPIGVLVSLAIVKLRGARCATMFHEPSGTSGPRVIDRIRGAFQDWTVRNLHHLSQKSVFSVPLSLFHGSRMCQAAPLLFRSVRIFPKISPTEPLRAFRAIRERASWYFA